MNNKKNSLDKWVSFLSEMTDDFTYQITPLIDLDLLIKDLFTHKNCPFSGLQVSINHFEVSFKTEELGKLSSSPKVQSDPFHGSEANIEIKYELKDSSVSSRTWYPAFERLLRITWIPDSRVHGTLSLKNDRLTSLLPAALDTMSTNGIHCIYSDLDEFGKINKQISQGEGDKAIRVVLGHIERCGVDQRMICTIDGGDEYVLFIENQGELSLLNTLDRLKKNIAQETYSAKKLRVGITFGIHKLDAWSDVESINYAKDLADKALKKDDGSSTGTLEKNRGTVSFSIYDEVTPNDFGLSNEDFFKLSISLINCRQNVEAPFSNLFLNFISRVTYNFIEEKSDELFNNHIVSYLKWLGIELSDEPVISEIIGDDHKTKNVSKSALLLAIAHGHLRSTNETNLSLLVKNTDLLLINNEDSTPIYGDDIQKETIDVTDYAIGNSIVIDGENKVLSNCVLVAIGNEQRLFTDSGNPFPSDIFSGIILLDDRPHSGGGLPDFWQAAIAQLININHKKHITKIIVLGSTEGTPKVVSYLTNSTEGDIDQIATLTASPRQLTEKFIALIKDEKLVSFCESTSDAINVLYDAKSDLKDLILSEQQELSKASINREIQLPESQLSLIQGLSCNSAAIAYPIILELFRTTTEVDINTYDNTETPLKEVIGFKLRLDKPLNNKIPDYWSNSKDALEDYASEVLISDTGLIGEKLKAESQFDHFIKHLSKYCSHDREEKASTRRAILIVPNQFIEDDIKPLGLVSIWATPRLQEGKFVLDFCFVWRTVEVLVGLPYSLFGSIKFTEYVKEILSKELGETDINSSDLQIGNLTYIALSLHMKIDDYNKKIAKSIVDAASI